MRDTLQVLLTDGAGHRLSGRLVTWTVMAGGGAVAPVGDTTDADGVAMAVWTLGPQSGPNAVAARTSADAVTFTTVAEAFRVAHLTSSAFLGCGLVDAAVWCWGQDAWTSTDPVSVRPSPGPGWYADGAPGRVDGLAGAVALAASASSVCALDGGGAVRCASGQTPLSTAVPGLPPMRRVAGAAWGAYRYCGLAAADSTAWCWRALQGAEAVAQVPGSPAFIDLAIDGDGDVGSGPYGGALACGIRADSTAACWGARSLGDGPEAESASPVAVSGGHRFAELAVGAQFACGRRADGQVWCWGRNDAGQLGSGPGPDALTPVLAVTGVTRIVASQDIVLASRNGAIVRWGGSWLNSSMPGPVPTLAGLDVAGIIGGSIACVSLADGQVYCYDEVWDRSSNYAVGDYAPVHPVVVQESAAQKLFVAPSRRDAKGSWNR